MNVSELGTLVWETNVRTPQIFQPLFKPSFYTQKDGWNLWYTLRMKLIFDYNRDKDVWCLLNKGKSSNNSSHHTKVYEELVAETGDNPSREDTSRFIDEYFRKNKIVIDYFVKLYLTDWEIIAKEYHKRAETIFGVELPENVTAYLSVNNRNPYSITENLFYVSIPRETVRKTIMHELWHFYTWYGLGVEQEERLGKEKYNEVKEALTVLLNTECADLLPERVYDNGYPQHQELRKKISELWEESNDIHKLWSSITA